MCPFCYLGRQSLSQYKRRATTSSISTGTRSTCGAEARPDGTIDYSVDDGKDDDYYEQAKQGVRRLQERYDVEMTLDLGTDVDSLPAQIVSYYVEEHADYETWLAFDVAVFEALWQDGQDIGDEDLLVELAEDAGVDGDEIRSALADGALRSEVRENFTAAKRQGITGVPTFAYDGHAARGAVPPEQLERLVEGS